MSWNIDWFEHDNKFEFGTIGMSEIGKKDFIASGNFTRENKNIIFQYYLNTFKDAVSSFLEDDFFTDFDKMYYTIILDNLINVYSLHNYDDFILIDFEVEDGFVYDNYLKMNCVFDNTTCTWSKQSL